MPVTKHFTINTSNLVDSLGDTIPGLTEDAVEYWVLYSAQQVIMQAGLDIQMVYDGRTTDLPGCQGVGSPDGVAQVGARDMGFGNFGWSNGEDVCVNSTANFSLSESPPVDGGLGGNTDLVAILMHEFMHWLGLLTDNDACDPDFLVLPPGHLCDRQGHVEDTTLDEGAVQGTIAQRTLTGTDIRRLRFLVSKLKGSGCSAGGANLALAKLDSGPFPPQWQPSNALDPHIPSIVALTAPGAEVAGDWVVAALTGGVPNGIKFVRARVSSGLDSRTDFTVVSYPDDEFDTYASPAIAKSDNLWVAVWPRRRELNYTCPGLRVATSSDAFATIDTQYTLAQPNCTAEQVALEWDPASERFILLFVYDSPVKQNYFSDPGDSFQAAVFARTSTNGLDWTPLQLLGKSTSTPGVACNATECMLTATGTAFTYPIPLQASVDFTVDSSGQLQVMNGPTSDFAWQASKVAIGASLGVFGVKLFHMVHWAPFPWWATDLKSGWAFAHAGTEAPPTQYDYNVLFPGDERFVRFPAALASRYDSGAVPDPLTENKAKSITCGA